MQNHEGGKGALPFNDVFIGRLLRILHLTQRRSHLGMFLWVTTAFQEAPHHPAVLLD